MKTPETLKIGIADYGEMKARTVAVVRGSCKLAGGRADDHPRTR